MRESGLKSNSGRRMAQNLESLSMRESGLKYFAGVVIEKLTKVSLHAREWIEMDIHPIKMQKIICLSPCERVDWNMEGVVAKWIHYVSLHAREWIEIAPPAGIDGRTFVSLHAREWIEIIYAGYFIPSSRSLSMRESGLKSYQGKQYSIDKYVSLHAREWIEIKMLICRAIQV